MNLSRYLKISEFSRLCGIPRKNLIFYDEIGLLKPERVLDNGYRYYGIRQVDSASVIVALREIGMSLADIKKYLTGRNPTTLVELLIEEKKVLLAKMNRLHRIEAMLDTRLNITKKALKVDISKIEVMECPEEMLFISKPVNNSNEETAEQSAYDFYDFCDHEGMTYGYPLGDIISKESLENGGELWPQRFFFKYPLEECCNSNSKKPAGLYLISYERSYYDVPRGGYDKLFRYMDENGYEVGGDAYEEFLLDEIAVKEENEFLLQISIQVRRKND